MADQIAASRPGDGRDNAADRHKEDIGQQAKCTTLPTFSRYTGA